MDKLIDLSNQVVKKKRTRSPRITRSYVTISHIRVRHDVAYFDLLAKFKRAEYCDYSAWHLSTPFLAPYIDKDGDSSRLLALIGKKAVFRISDFDRAMDHGRADIRSFEVVDDECELANELKSEINKNTLSDKDTNNVSDAEAG